MCIFIILCLCDALEEWLILYWRSSTNGLSPVSSGTGKWRQTKVWCFETRRCCHGTPSGLLHSSGKGYAMLWWVDGTRWRTLFWKTPVQMTGTINLQYRGSEHHTFIVKEAYLLGSVCYSFFLCRSLSFLFYNYSIQDLKFPVLCGNGVVGHFLANFCREIFSIYWVKT